MSAYADTSFLVSLYVLDANSARAAARMRRASLPLFLSSFGELELTNAIGLRLFRGDITASAAKASHTLIRGHLEHGVLFARPAPATAYERAKRISRKRTPRLGTRTLDVLHVAIALTLQATTFYTFDARQSELAAAEGLQLA